MAARESFSDMEDIVKASWSLYQRDVAAPYNLSQRSPLPPVLTGKVLSRRQSPILNVRQIGRINRHPVESDEDSGGEIMLDPELRLNWNDDMDKENYCEDICVADIESETDEWYGIQEPESPEPWDVSAVPHVPRLFQPTWKSERQAKEPLAMGYAIETKKNERVKKKYNRLR